MTQLFSFTSILFSMFATVSYSYEVKLVLFWMAAMSLCVAVTFFISSLIEKDSVVQKVNTCPEVKIPLRDSKGRYVKGHAPTHLKK